MSWTFINESFEGWLDSNPNSKNQTKSSFKNYVDNLSFPQDSDQNSIKKELFELFSSFSTSSQFLDNDAFSELGFTTSILSKDIFADEMPALGAMIGHYRLEEILGRGGFGQVYKAYDEKLRRFVAIKLSIKENYEAQSMAQLEHENIAKVYDQGSCPNSNLHYTVTEYIGGPSLELLLEQWEEGSLKDFLVQHSHKDLSFRSNEIQVLNDLNKLSSTEYLLQVVKDITQALEAAHQKKVYHLDIKPSNILITHYGRAKLIDFNISVDQDFHCEEKLMVGGSKKYMSPEQKCVFEASSVQQSKKLYQGLDQRCDIYALGILIKKISEKNCLSEDEKNVPPCAHNMVNERIKELSDSASHSDLNSRISNVKVIREGLQEITELSQLMKANPTLGKENYWSQRPFAAMVAAALIPQLSGSFVNIAYNSSLILPVLTKPQEAKFVELLKIYNPIVYSVCIGLVIFVFYKAKQFLKKPFSLTDSPSEALVLENKIKGSRAKSLEDQRFIYFLFPRYLFVIFAIGWLPGIFYFPMGVSSVDQPLSFQVNSHFVLSFILGWVVATSYSMLFTQSFSLFQILPFRFRGRKKLGLSEQDLKFIEKRYSWGHVLSGVFPLIGAIVLLLLDSSQYNELQRAVYNGLTVFCILLSAASFILGERLKNKAFALTRFLLSQGKSN